MLAFLASFFRSASPAPVRLCKDCRWHETVDQHPKCENSQAGEINLITGDVEQRFCSVERMAGGREAVMLNLCGKQARWFEPRA